MKKKTLAMIETELLSEMGKVIVSLHERIKLLENLLGVHKTRAKKKTEKAKRRPGRPRKAQ